MDRDRQRQLWVTASEALCIYGTLLGTGVLGRRVEESSGGSLAADATLLAPGAPAFSIWSAIYLGLFAYTVWQWLPANKTSERARATGWLAGVSMLLNAGWLLVTQYGLIWLSVGVIVALLVTLVTLVRRLTALPAADLADRVILDGTFGAYLGWVSIATAANVTAAAVASGWTLGPVADQALAVAILAVAAGVGILLARALGGRLAVAAALAWGLTWIAVARLTTEPESTLVGVAALVAALIVAVSAVASRRPRLALARA
nr:tryptophan-rich sensory protein [Propionibacterium sp.]